MVLINPNVNFKNAKLARSGIRDDQNRVLDEDIKQILFDYDHSQAGEGAQLYEIEVRGPDQFSFFDFAHVLRYRSISTGVDICSTIVYSKELSGGKEFLKQ